LTKSLTVMLDIFKGKKALYQQYEVQDKQVELRPLYEANK